jgi:methionine sulfoxide reductase heme-binding subunit
MLRKAVKVVVFLAALSPAAWVVTLTVTDILGRTHALGANPIDALTDTTGIWTLRFVLLSLAVTPARRLTGWNGLIRYRRMLGLFAFFYASLHFTTWIGLDQGLLWPYVLPEAAPDQAVTWAIILGDIAKRPYITVGFLGFLLMVPLALTSTAGWIRRLGGRWWNRLHRLVYVTGICGVVHFLWLVKVIETEQIVYAAILTVLLGLRLWWAITKGIAGRPAPVRQPLSSPRVGSAS